MDLASFIRPIPDFPKPGILFRDITPLLADAGAFATAIARLAAPWRGASLDAIAAVCGTIAFVLLDGVNGGLASLACVVVVFAVRVVAERAGLRTSPVRPLD